MLWLKSRSHLNFFEILAKDGLNLGDGNEGGAIYFLDYFNDAHSIGAMSNDEQHFGVLMVVAAGTFQEGGTPMQFGVDALGNLMVF